MPDQCFFLSSPLYPCEAKFVCFLIIRIYRTWVFARVYVRNWLKCCRRSLLVRRSFVLKVAPNHGKRYGELPKDQKQCLAISWNAISSFMFACKAWNCSFHPHSCQSQSDTLLVHKCSLTNPSCPHMASLLYCRVPVVDA